MKRVALALLVTAALVLPAAARAGTVFGVTEDAGKYSTDGGAAFFSRLRDVGMTENAVSVQWDPDRPGVIAEAALLDRLVPTASRFGVRLIFSVYFTRPNAIASRPGAAAEFAAFLRKLARTYPQVKDFVVGNEPNYGVFWQPQFEPDGTPAAGAAYEDVLARSYDSLKSVDPRINVIGFGLAARGNDRPESASPSTSPILFLRDVGEAYRRSGRTRPLADSFAYHPYPASDLDSAGTRQGWPSAGVADLDRLKQAVWDAFHDTAQPTFENGLPLRITEIGWQAAIPALQLEAYDGGENVRTTDEATQARIYAQLVRELTCDPAVTEVLFFHLIDEPNLSGFQSGLIRADGSLRPAYAAVQRAIAETGGRCNGVLRAWRHTDEVVGADVGFEGPDGDLRLTVTAQEAASYRAAVVRIDGTPTDTERFALERSLTRPGVAGASGTVRAYGRIEPDLEVPKEAGTYVQAVLLNSATNSSRTSLFLSAPFSVREPGAASTAPAQDAAPGGTDNGSSSDTLWAGERTVFAVAPAAPGTRRSAPGFRALEQPMQAAGPTSAAFRSLPPGSARAPRTSEPSSGAGKAEIRSDATASRALSLGASQPSTMPPLLVALLLAGAALSAVVAVRLLKR